MEIKLEINYRRTSRKSKIVGELSTHTIVKVKTSKEVKTNTSVEI